MKRAFGLVIALFLVGSTAMADGEHNHGGDSRYNTHGFFLFEDSTLYLAHYVGEYPHNGQVIIQAQMVDQWGQEIKFENLNSRVIWFDSDRPFSLQGLGQGLVSELHTGSVSEDFADGSSKEIYKGDVYIFVTRVVFSNMLDN